MTTPADEQTYPSSVRLPSHLQPPYRARTWSYFSQLNIAAGAPLPGLDQAFTIFGGPASGVFVAQPVPPGMRAEITWVNVCALDLAGVLTASPDSIRATIRKNGQAVQGWIEFGLQFSTTIGAFEIVGDQVPVTAPIHLEEGDIAVLSVAMFNAGVATTWAIQARWAGWLYPVTVEGDAGSIRGTATDPGITPKR